MTDADFAELVGDDFGDLSQVLLAALEQTRAAACITTADLDSPGPTIVYVNPAYCAMTGRARAEVIGCSPRIMQGPLTERSELDRLRTDLEAGRPFEGETVNYRADGTPFIINWRIDHVRDASGRTTHYVATQEDVTHQRRIERLLAAEQRLDEALTTALATRMGLEEGLRFLVETAAAGASTVATYGQVVVDVQIDGASYRSPTRVEIAADTDAFQARLDRPESAIVGTLEIRGMTADQSAFVDEVGLTGFAQRAVNVMGALVEYQRQRRTSLRLQQDLLPGPPPSVPGFTVATAYLPGSPGVDVGGDWFDLTVLDDRILVSVGDVSGSGVDAAALMGRLRLLAGVELGRGAEVHSVLRLLDGVCRAEEQFATMLVVELSGSSIDGRVWSAGHPPPIRTSTTGAARVEVVPSPPLGHLQLQPPEPSPTEVALGDGLLLFTDGLVERRGESPDTGIDRVCRSISGLVDPDEIVARVGEDEADRSDDVAVLSLRRTR